MMTTMKEIWAQRETEKNECDQARVMCLCNPDPQYNVIREEHRRNLRFCTESQCRSFAPLPRTDEGYAALQGEQHAVFERIHHHAAVQKRKTVEASAEEEPEWAHYPDKLTELIGKQLSGLGSVTIANVLIETQIRIHQIAQAFLQYDPQLVFNLSSVLDREILHTILQPIFAFYEEHLRECKPYAFTVCGRGCKPFTTEYTLLHEYMQKYGYSVDIVKEYIREEQAENRPPVLGTYYIHYGDSATDILRTMDPAVLRFRAPKAPSVYQQIQVLKKARVVVVTGV
jgi:hypothetical protein